MAKAPAGLGIAAAAVGLWFLLREVKSIELPALPDFSLFPSDSPGRKAELLKRTEDLQIYEAERVTDATRLETERAKVGLIAGNYGTIPSGITGSWHAAPPPGADECYIITASPYASNTTRFFTGKFCREAQAAGFIDPWTGAG